MKIKLFVALIPVFLLESCYHMIDSTEYLAVKNIYKAVDMRYFYGYVDNISTTRLTEIYGKPDSIFDAYEPTLVEGYNIYEYKVDDGYIDCYVPKQEKGMTPAVEYIYFEPNNKIDVSKFIKDKELINTISTSKNDIYYIADSNHNFIRIRIDDKDRNKITNIALDDVTLLDLYNCDIADVVEDAKKNIPCDFTNLGTLTNMKFSDNCLSFDIGVNETETIKLSDILIQTPELANGITSYILYNQGGYIGYTDNSIIKRQANISYKFKGKLSNQVKEIVIPFNKLKSLIGTNSTNERALSGRILLDNCLCPMKLNDWLISEKKYIKDNCLIIPFRIIANQKEIDNLYSDFKLYVASLFTDYDNPDSQYVNYAYKCDYDMIVVFYIDGTDKKMVAEFSQDDLWIMMENTK